MPCAHDGQESTVIVGGVFCVGMIRCESRQCGRATHVADETGAGKACDVRCIENSLPPHSVKVQRDGDGALGWRSTQFIPGAAAKLVQQHRIQLCGRKPVHIAMQPQLQLQGSIGSRR